MHRRIAERRVETNNEERAREGLRTRDGTSYREGVYAISVRIAKTVRSGKVHSHRVRRGSDLAIVCQRRHLVVEATVAGANAGLSSAENIPGKSETRIENRPHGIDARFRVSGSPAASCPGGRFGNRCERVPALGRFIKLGELTAGEISKGDKRVPPQAEVEREPA